MAENDFLHSLLSKVTASKGDSGGQGKVDYCFFFPLSKVTSNFSGTSFYIVYILEKGFPVRAVAAPWRWVSTEAASQES